MLAILKREKTLFFFGKSLLSFTKILENRIAEWKHRGKQRNTAEGQCEGAEGVVTAGRQPKTKTVSSNELYAMQFATLSLSIKQRWSG